jgi:hypothetical protein
MGADAVSGGRARLVIGLAVDEMAILFALAFLRLLPDELKSCSEPSQFCHHG